MKPKRTTSKVTDTVQTPATRAARPGFELMNCGKNGTKWFASLKTSTATLTSSKYTNAASQNDPIQFSGLPTDTTSARSRKTDAMNDTARKANATE
jgi:hypothetical protein